MKCFRPLGPTILIAAVLGGAVFSLRGEAVDVSGRGRLVRQTFSNPARIAIPASVTIAAGITMPAGIFVIPGDITIPAAGRAQPYPATIRVSGFSHASITDVNVTLRRFNHSWPWDVDVMLVAPNGKTAILMSDAGGTAPVTNVTFTLDDQATMRLPQNGPVANRRYRPANYGGSADVFPPPAPGSSPNVSLATFNGGDPNGDWRLFVVDDNGNDAGAIAGGWSLHIVARNRR